MRFKRFKGFKRFKTFKTFKRFKRFKIWIPLSILKPQPLWTGKQMVSYLLPPLFMEKRVRGADKDTNDWDDKERVSVRSSLSYDFLDGALKKLESYESIVASIAREKMPSLIYYELINLFKHDDFNIELFANY